MKRFGKKIDRPKIKRRNTLKKGPGPVGVFVRGKACSKCKRMRDYCKCKTGFNRKRNPIPLDY